MHCVPDGRLGGVQVVEARLVRVTFVVLDRLDRRLHRWHQRGFEVVHRRPQQGAVIGVCADVRGRPSLVLACLPARRSLGQRNIILLCAVRHRHVVERPERGAVGWIGGEAREC